MKKAVSFYAAALAICALSGNAIAGEAGYTAGTYSGASQGHSSDVVVEAVFTEDGIESVSVDASGETPEIGGAAAEDLAAQFTDAQSADIDGVAGATETTEAPGTTEE